MNEPRSEPADRDLRAAYADGDPAAVRAAACREPAEAEWEAARQRIHDRLATARVPLRRRWRGGFWIAAGAALTATAAAVGWVAFQVAAPTITPLPEVVQKPAPPHTPVAPAPHEPQDDPLAGFAVLPMATADDVVLHRVPGDGWLPVGAELLPDSLSLATTDEVKLDVPAQNWLGVSPSPGDAPMIFAAKPR